MRQHTTFGGRQNTPLNIAHRGARARYPENTMPAFYGAVEAGANMIELDVRLSKDGVPVIFHDARLDSLMQAAGFVAQSALTALKKLDVGAWFHPEFADESIPTLDEVLAFAKDTIPLNIEMKTDPLVTDGQLEQTCLELVAGHDMQNQVLFSSFNAEAVGRIKQHEPGISTALLFNSSDFSGVMPSQLVEKYQADVFHCTYPQLTQKRLEDLREHNIPVTVYTINNETTMKKLIALPVHGIITDKPNLLNRIIFECNDCNER